MPSSTIPHLVLRQGLSQGPLTSIWKSSRSPCMKAYRQAPPQLVFMWHWESKLSMSRLHGWHFTHGATLAAQTVWKEFLLYEQCLSTENMFSEALCADPNVLFPQGMMAELLENQEVCLRRGLAPNLCCHLPFGDSSAES